MKKIKILLLLTAVAFIAAGCGSKQTSYGNPQPAPVQPPASAAQKPPETSAPPLHTIGQITRHAGNFAGQLVRVQGYVLKQEKGYAIFSDESAGAIGVYDLPVTGAGVENAIPKQKYSLQGTFIHLGLDASNHNPYHLELSVPLTPVN